MTGLAKGVNARLKLLPHGPQTDAFLRQLEEETCGNAGWHRQRGRHHPGSWCFYDEWRWAELLHTTPEAVRKTRQHLVAKQIIWFAPDRRRETAAGAGVCGSIGWGTDLAAWQPIQRGSSGWGGRRTGAGRPRGVKTASMAMEAQASPVGDSPPDMNVGDSPRASADADARVHARGADMNSDSNDRDAGASASASATSGVEDQDDLHAAGAAHEVHLRLDQQVPAVADGATLTAPTAPTMVREFDESADGTDGLSTFGLSPDVLEVSASQKDTLAEEQSEESGKGERDECAAAVSAPTLSAPGMLDTLSVSDQLATFPEEAESLALIPVPLPVASAGVPTAPPSTEHHEIQDGRANGAEQAGADGDEDGTDRNQDDRSQNSRWPDNEFKMAAGDRAQPGHHAVRDRAVKNRRGKEAIQKNGRSRSRRAHHTQSHMSAPQPEAAGTRAVSKRTLPHVPSSTTGTSGGVGDDTAPESATRLGGFGPTPVSLTLLRAAEDQIGLELRQRLRALGDARGSSGATTILRTLLSEGADPEQLPRLLELGVRQFEKRLVQDGIARRERWANWRPIRNQAAYLTRIMAQIASDAAARDWDLDALRSHPQYAVEQDDVGGESGTGAAPGNDHDEDDREGAAAGPCTPAGPAASAARDASTPLGEGDGERRDEIADQPAAEDVPWHTFPQPHRGDLWRHACDELRQKMTRQQYDTWFGGTWLVEAPDGQLALCVRSNFTRELLETRFRSRIVQAIRNVCPPTSPLQSAAQGLSIVASTLDETRREGQRQEQGPGQCEGARPRRPVLAQHQTQDRGPERAEQAHEEVRHASETADVALREVWEQVRVSLTTRWRCSVEQRLQLHTCRLTLAPDGILTLLTPTAAVCDVLSAAASEHLIAALGDALGEIDQHLPAPGKLRLAVASLARTTADAGSSGSDAPSSEQLRRDNDAPAADTHSVGRG